MNKTWSKRLSVTLALLVGVAALSVRSAAAETLINFATRAANDTGTNTHFFKALTDGGATSLSFDTLTDRKPIRITYNAECGVLGSVGSWVSVTILIDGIEANPKTGRDFAFCSATSTNTFNWVGAVRQSFLTLQFAGRHRVQVLVDLNGAHTWWLGDSSIAIEGK